MFPCNSPQQESNNPQGKIQVPILDKTSNYLCRKRENKQASGSKKKKKEKDIFPLSHYPESFYFFVLQLCSFLKPDGIKTSKN